MAFSSKLYHPHLLNDFHHGIHRTSACCLRKNVAFMVKGFGHQKRYGYRQKDVVFPISFRVAIKRDASGERGEVNVVSDISVQPDLDDGNGSGDWRFFNGAGGNGKFPPGGGGSDGSQNEEEDAEAAQFGPILKFEEVMREVEAWGARLPSDMFEAAKTVGIRKFFS